jgi:hypothetical protein
MNACFHWKRKNLTTSIIILIPRVSKRFFSLNIFIDIFHCYCRHADFSLWHRKKKEREGISSLTTNKQMKKNRERERERETKQRRCGRKQAQDNIEEKYC